MIRILDGWKKGQMAFIRKIEVPKHYIQGSDPRVVFTCQIKPIMGMNPEELEPFTLSKSQFESAVR
jgi:hypothetical protein